MLKRYAAALAALSLLASIPASADYVIRDGQSTPAQQTFGSFSLSGVQFPKHVMIDPTTGAAIGVPGNPIVVLSPPSNAISITKTTAIGTTGVQVSAADLNNRRTVRNTSSIACEIMGGANAYGTGHPLPAGENFTFDNGGRTTVALFVACASAGGSVSVISY